MEFAQIGSYLDGLPELDRIPTVDEVNAAVDQLVARVPGRCRVRRIGTSRLGEPLRLLSVGHGSRHALVIGCPHPNEPIGLLTVSHLAALVADHPELSDGIGYTWNFVPCVDPDGTRLNEGWFAGPHTIRHYHENFYRPAMRDQPEWTFPVLDERAYFDRTLPETNALIRVIDELRPRFQYSLHNADFGGVFFILNQEVPGAAGDLVAMAARQQVPLSHGQIDTLGWSTAGPAVYLMPSAETLITAHTGASAEPRSGGSSSHYAARHGATTLITEVPFWHDERASDLGESGRLHAEVLRDSANRLRTDAAMLAELWQRVEPRLVVPSPLRSAARDFMASSESLASASDAVAATAAGRAATVAEVFTAECVVHMLRLRTVGVLRRQLAVEQAAGNGTPSLRGAYQELGSLFDTWCHAAADALSGELFPLRRLVGLQMGAALAVVSRLDGGQ
ncbi:MAG TPA: M14 family zinc carboxypeptidase [Pseudonocardiaceae bacterium]|nr:M14 family zinc carboxypeptidase [Pseudonocardiaceae bacterium]